MNSAPRRLGLPGLISVALLLATLSSCVVPDQPQTTTPSTNGLGLVAEVATYQMVAGQAGRLLVALLTADDRWLSFGSVGMRFSYLGDEAAMPSADVGLGDRTATFLAIPGSPEGQGRGRRP